MYLLGKKKKTTETVLPKTMNEEVTDNHMSSLGIPCLQLLITSLSCADQLEQNMELHKIHLFKIRFYHKSKNSKQLQASLKSHIRQIHQVSVPHWKNQRS